MSVADASFRILRPWLAARADDGRWVVTDKGRLARIFQEKYGDVVMNRRGQLVTIELKAEQRQTGNLFLEDWSNRPVNPGWMYKLDTDFLLYHFLDADWLGIIPFPALRQWAFEEPSMQRAADGRHRCGRLYDFASRPQASYDQLNQTWGRIVPVEVIREEVGLQVVNPRAEMAPTPLDAGDCASSGAQASLTSDLEGASHQRPLRTAGGHEF